MLKRLTLVVSSVVAVIGVPALGLCAAKAKSTGAANSAEAEQGSDDIGKKFGWQCVTFARMFSGIQIFGDAFTWWEKAGGKYAKGHAPQKGSVLVFQPTNRMRVGHVAVVSQVVTDRVIQITHANWSPIDGKRGQVEKDVTVVDVSTDGDWSKVKVWYDPSSDIGNTVYPTYGFIYQTANSAQATVAGAIRAKAASDARDAAAAKDAKETKKGVSMADLFSQIQ